MSFIDQPERSARRNFFAKRLVAQYCGIDPIAALRLIGSRRA
ncbi:hypothetical protein [Xanthobacter agilis]|jgi:hypothetical protein|uniref:Uncharacterized protein n=1 Tax=Xanthobacter agilis TaxID=47492 RepID=A0ABU0LAK4_XANAG|nr:hypothetical protein [Xanthobacter agilis]MDQ0504174.1 hypothetical protein [Xanthobacter agilis]